MDSNKDPEQISLNMTSGKAVLGNLRATLLRGCKCSPPPLQRTYSYNAVLALYSLLFMRFGWMVQPRNYLLMSVHVVNEAAQLNLMQKKLRHECVPQCRIPGSTCTYTCAATSCALATLLRPFLAYARCSYFKKPADAAAPVDTPTKLQ